MAKYSKFERKNKATASYKIHPVWTGIGFLMIIIVPIISWAGAVEAVKFAKDQGWPFLRSFPTYLDMFNSIPGLTSLARIQNLPAIAMFFILILVVLSGLLSFGYAIVYRVVGPPRYAPDDEPAPRVKTKKYGR